MERRKLKTNVLIATFVLLICTGLFVLYMVFPASNVKSIKVTGNYFLSDEYIKELADVKQRDKYILVSRPNVQNKVEKDDLIERCHVSFSSGNAVTINVVEKKIVGYQVTGQNAGSVTSLILADGTVLDFSQHHIENLALLPLFVDIDADKIEKIAKQLQEIDEDVLYRISEIHNVKFTYDDDMLKLYMDDGYTLYVSINDLPNISLYLKIIENKTNYSCIYFDEYKKATVRDCSEIESYIIKNEVTDNDNEKK